MTNHAARWALTILVAGLVAGCCCPGATPADGAPTVLDEDPQQVFISLTTVRIPEAQVASALGSLCPESPQKPRALSQARSEALLKQWRDDEHVQVLQAPKLVALNGQKATISIGETIRFARTKAVTNERGGLEFSMEDGPVFVGYELSLIPRVEGERIAIELHAAQRAIPDGLSQSEIAAMDQETFLRQIVVEHRIDASFDMSDGGHVLIGSPRMLEDADGRYVSVSLLNARVLQEGPAKATTITNG